MKKFAIIVAGGQGQRMGSAIPKQYIELNQKPILYHTINAFWTTYPDINIIVVLPESHISWMNMVLQAFGNDRPDLTIVAGGATRYHSVKNGFDQIKDLEAIVFVHDGVRPLVSSKIIKDSYHTALEFGAAIPVINMVDSMREMVNGNHFAVDRNNYKAVQTPQTFQYKVLQKAYEIPYEETFTDEASVVEAAGMEVYLFPGERKNIKVTTPEDLLIASAFMNS